MAILEELRLATGKRCWRAQISPRLPGIHGIAPLSSGVIATQYSSDELSDVDERSIPVRVCRVITEPVADRFSDGDLAIEFTGDLAKTSEELPEVFDEEAFFETTLKRIGRYIEIHGDSRIARQYLDEDGPLGGIIAGIRWHYAGLTGVSPGPFPGVDYVSRLNEIDGWSWNLDDSLDMKKFLPE